jgi:hypothetical protein
MIRLIHKSKPAAPRPGDQIILDMRSGMGYVARDGYPMKLKSGGGTPLSAYRFDSKSQTPDFHAHVLLGALGATSQLKLNRRSYSNPAVSCFELTEGGA